MATEKLASGAITLAGGTQLNALSSVAGRSAILIGPTVTGYETINATMYAVGGTDGAVSIANNQEIVKLQSSALQNPYAVIPTAYDFQINFTLQEVDIPNIALALAYKAANAATAATTGTNFYDVQTSGNDDYGNAHPFDGTGSSTIDLGASANPGAGGDWDTFLNLDPAFPAPYRSMRIVTLAPQSSEATVAYYGWDFFKVKIVSQGTIDFDRTANITLPVTAHCLGNDSDVVGRLWHTDTLTLEQLRGYPS